MRPGLGPSLNLNICYLTLGQDTPIPDHIQATIHYITLHLHMIMT